MTPRLLFIIGAPRSGTTILRHILNSHPKILLTNEWAIPELISHFNHWAHIRPWIVKSFMTDFMENLYRKHAPYKEQLEFIGDKSPCSHSYYDVIRQTFPRMILIETLRDPYEIAASGLARKDNWKLTLEQHMSHTLSSWNMHRKAEIENVHVIKVKLEELITFPQTVLKDVCYNLDVSCGGGFVRDAKYQIGELVPKVKKLTTEQIKIINDTLTEDVIRAMGYPVL